jgi:Type II secretory pathway, component PulF
MPRFDVRVATRKGIKSVIVDAMDAKEATRLGAKQGRVTSVNRKFGFDLTPGMKTGDRYTWMIRMSTLMASKYGTAEGLKLMRDTFGGSIKKVSATMLERIESGMDMPTAMEQDRRNFPGTTTALVKAGSATGETWRALRHAAEFEYKMANVHKGSMKQVYSAIGSFLMAGGLMLGTTMYFGPMVLDNPMFANAEGVDVEWARAVGDWCSGIMIVLMVIFGIFAWFGTIGRQMMPDLADKIILKIPYYKDLILSRNNHVTLYRLGLLIGSGVRIEEALSLTEASSPRGALKADLQRALLAVRNGKPWAKAMDTLHDTDKAALSTSTNRDDIANTLDILANQYSDLYIQRISTFAPALGSVAAIFMTLAGGVLFIQTILPMLQLSASY